MAIDIEAPGADEADLKAAIQALANDITVVTISANTTLNSSHYGKVVFVSASNVLVGFPAAPATTQVLRVYNGSAGNITVNGVLVGAAKDILHISIGSGWQRFQPSVSGVGGSLFPVPSSGMHIPGRVGPIGNGAGLFNGYIFWDAISVPYDLEISEIAVDVATAVGASTAAVAIYADDGNTPIHQPVGTPIAQGAATFSTATTNVKFVPLAANVTLQANTRYWAAVCGTTGVALKAEVGCSYLMIGGTIQNPLVGVSVGGQGWQSQTTTNVIGTWPASVPGLSPGGASRFIPFLKVV